MDPEEIKLAEQRQRSVMVLLSGSDTGSSANLAGYAAHAGRLAALVHFVRDGVEEDEPGAGRAMSLAAVLEVGLHLIPVQGRSQPAAFKLECFARAASLASELEIPVIWLGIERNDIQGSLDIHSWNTLFSAQGLRPRFRSPKSTGELS